MQRDSATPPIFDPTTPSGVAPGYAEGPNGLTLGGIQLAGYDYSAAVNDGAGTTGPAFCWLTGLHRWYSDQVLAARYPDPQSYLVGARTLTERGVASGFLLRTDARRTLRTVHLVYRAAAADRALSFLTIRPSPREVRRIRLTGVRRHCFTCAEAPCATGIM